MGIAAETGCTGLHTLYNRHAEASGKQTLLAEPYFVRTSCYLKFMLQECWKSGQTWVSLFHRERFKKKIKSCEQNLWHILHGYMVPCSWSSERQHSMPYHLEISAFPKKEETSVSCCYILSFWTSQQDANGWDFSVSRETSLSGTPDAGWMLKTAITGSADKPPVSCYPKAHSCFGVSARNVLTEKEKIWASTHVLNQASSVSITGSSNTGSLGSPRNLTNTYCSNPKWSSTGDLWS